MSSIEVASSRRDDEESILVRNVDLARQRLMRRGGELEVVLCCESLSRRERAQRLNYALSGLDAAHAELRGAMKDLAAFDLRAAKADQRETLTGSETRMIA